MKICYAYDDNYIFYKPTKDSAYKERDRRNRITIYKNSHKPITVEQFKDLRDGDIYYYHNKLDREVMSKHFCDSNGRNSPTDESLIAGDYGPIYWTEEDALNNKPTYVYSLL